MQKRKPNILMITESFFPDDIRVRKEAYHLKERLNVSVIALRNKSEKFFEKDGDVTIYRIPELPDINLGKLRYILEYFYFTFVSACIFICTAPFKRYKVVHVHNPPDTLFVVGFLCKLFRMKFVFDHHDLSPNLYLTRFSGGNDWIYKTMIKCERYSCRLADAVIATNETYKEIEQQRHDIDPSKIFVVRNNPILEDCLLDPDGDNNSMVINKDGNKNILLFIGAINPQDGLTELLKALHYLVFDLNEKNFICNVVGEGDSLDSVRQAASEMELDEYMNFTGVIYDRQKIKEYLYQADIGVEPAPKNELNIHSTFIKIMEYMAAGIPIVAFDLKETRYSANGSALLVTPGDIAGFAKNIQQLFHDETLRQELGSAGSARIKNDLNWDSATKVLDEAYSRVVQEAAKMQSDEQ